MTTLRRMRINQPSTLQPDHALHGTNVLAERLEGRPVSRVYFLNGDVISSEMLNTSLSLGWIAPGTRRLSQAGTTEEVRGAPNADPRFTPD